MPRPARRRPAGLAEARQYAGKADEYLLAARDCLAAGRFIAATSLAVHAGINAADAVSAVRVGARSAGQDHDEVLALLGQAGPDGADAAKALRRLLPLKTKAEYDPDDIPKGTAERAVTWAETLASIARRVVTSIS